MLEMTYEAERDSPIKIDGIHMTLLDIVFV